MKKYLELAFYTILASRPVHIVKNCSLFAAIVFTETLFVKGYFIKVLQGFLVFSFATSATYVLNDLLDVKNDMLHPIKKFRPIASGKLPKEVAVIWAIFLGISACFFASRLGELFFISVIGYLVLQVLYSIYLKHIPVIDILTIASGFIIRVYAGAFVINAHLSVWFLLCVISIALFFASGKRRVELNTISDAQNTRKSLKHYQRELLNSFVTMFGNATWMSWALFTFFESPKASLPVWLTLAEISKATTINKLLMVTIPVVIFSIMRYEMLIFDEKTEKPEKVLISDIPLVVSVFIWGALIFLILYSRVTL